MVGSQPIPRQFRIREARTHLAICSRRSPATRHQSGPPTRTASPRRSSAAPRVKRGDPDGFGSISEFGIDGDPKTLCYVLRVKKVDFAAEGMAAHIHRGAKGKNGPVLINLAAPFDGNSADCLTEGETLASGVKAVPGKVKVAEILANPARFYVNVHTPAYPDGAVRGS